MKHLSFCASITGCVLFILLLSSCRTAKSGTVPFTASIEGVRLIKSTSSQKASNFIGPPSPFPDEPLAIAKKLTGSNIEKGGKTTFVAPKWATKKPEIGIEHYSEAEVLQQAKLLKQYALENDYETSYAFLINIRVKSGKKRFYMVNLETMTIVNSALVAHGRGEERFTFDKDFSNAPGSNCTSLGRYKIGKPYTGQFGLAYRLYGLDNSNNNAYKRFVVLHAMGCISNEESNVPTCQSEGCPAVSPQFLQEIQPVIESRKKPMLLWVFNSAGNGRANK